MNVFIELVVTKFKVGDKVICINAELSNNILIHNQVYTIKDILHSNNYYLSRIFLKELADKNEAFIDWRADRFAPAETYLKHKKFEKKLSDLLSEDN